MILVNEYEMRRSVEGREFFAIHPEYRLPAHAAGRALGDEYTSANTRQLTTPEEIGRLLDAMGQVEYYM